MRDSRRARAVLALLAVLWWTVPLRAATPVVLTNVIVTSDQSWEMRDFGGGVFYVAAGDRSAGFKVRNLAAPFAGQVERGDIVRVEGLLDVEPDSMEACVLTYGDIAVSPFGKGHVAPLFMRSADLGGQTVNAGRPDERPGVTRPAPRGPHNKGLPVGVAGVVTHVNYFNRFFYVDDGCRLDDGYGPYGVRVSCDYQDLSLGQEPLPLPSLGSFVAVTGICSSEVWQGEVIRVVKVRDTSDIRVLLEGDAARRARLLQSSPDRPGASPSGAGLTLR